jgi:hypothetical protein
MTIVSTKRLFLLLLLVLASLPVAAQTKRRAVAPSIAMVLVTGKVVDVDTGAPVLSAQVMNGPRTSVTGSDGTYRVLVPVGLSSVISAGRTGYETAQTQVLGKDGLTVNFSLKGKPTVKVKLTDGTSFDADLESSQFAIEIPFSNTTRSDDVNLCRADGTKFSANIREFAKITGPGVSVTNQACCTATPVIKITTDLKNADHAEVVLADTCTGVFMDFAARNHLTGDFVYKRFEDIQEIVFP